MEGEDSGSPKPGDGKNDTKSQPLSSKATTDTRAGRSVTKRLRATQASFFKPPSSLRRHQCRRSAGRAPLARAPLSSSLSSLFFTSLAPRASMAAAPTASGPPDHARVAILGVACRLPGSQDAPAFWSLLLEGGNAISRVPTERWESSELYDPVPGAPPPFGPPARVPRHASATPCPPLRPFCFSLTRRLPVRRHAGQDRDAGRRLPGPRGLLRPGVLRHPDTRGAAHGPGQPPAHRGHVRGTLRETPSHAPPASRFAARQAQRAPCASTPSARPHHTAPVPVR